MHHTHIGEFGAQKGMLHMGVNYYGKNNHMPCGLLRGSNYVAQEPMAEVCVVRDGGVAWTRVGWLRLHRDAFAKDSGFPWFSDLASTQG